MMSTHKRVVSLILTVCAIAVCHVHGQETSKAPEKALRFLKVLKKRPSPGYLFDRFYNSWLDESTSEALETFLSERATADPTAPYGVILAIYYEKNGDTVKALEQYGRILEQGKDAQVLFLKGKLETRTLNFQQALADLEEALKRAKPGKTRTEIQKHLGRTYIRTGKTKKGLAVWNQLLAGGADEDLQEELIDLQLEEGLFEEALESVRTLKTGTRDKYRVVMLVLRESEIQSRIGAREKSRKLLKESLAKVGQGSWLEREILARIERLFEMEGDRDGLLDFYKGLTQEHSGNAALLSRYATILRENKRLKEAGEIAARLVEVAPLERKYRENLIDVLADSDQYEDALVHLAELQKRFPNDRELLIRKAMLCHRAKKPEAVKEALETFLKHADISDYDFLRVAGIYAKFDMPDDAGGTYEALLRKNPKSTEGQEMYAEHCFRTEQKDKAIATYTRLAGTADLETLLRINDSLSLREAHSTAYKLLTGRRGEFGEDAAFLRHLCALEKALDKPERALQTAMQWVEAAAGAIELRQAIGEVIGLGRKQKKLQAITDELASNAQRSVGQTCLLAELEYSAGDMGKAEAFLAAAAEKDPDSTILVDRRLDLAKRMRAMDKAIQILEEQLKRESKRQTRYLRELANLHLQRSDYAKALNAVIRWKTMNPNTTQPYLLEARIHQKSGDTRKAVAALKRGVLRLTDRAIPLQETLAGIYVAEGMAKDAKHVYWQLFEQAEKVEEKLEYVTELARSYAIGGDQTELIRHFQERIKNDKNSLFPVLAMVRIHQVGNNYEESRRYMMKAAQMRPDDIQMLHEIARIEERNGAYDRAESVLRKAAKLDKTDRSRQLLVQHYFSMGDDEKALNLHLQSASKGKLSPKEVESIGASLIGGQRYDLAKEFLQNHVEMFGKHVRLHYLYAVALKELGVGRKARREFIRMLSCPHEPQTPRKKTNRLNQYQGVYMKHMKTIMPDAAYSIMMGRSNSYTVLAYRRARNYSYGMFSMGGGGMSQAISLPADLTELKNYILVHLAEDCTLMDDEEQQDLAAELEASGVTHAKLRLTWNWQNARRPNYFEQFEQSDLIRILRIFASAQSGAEAKVDAGKEFEHFKKSWPDVAIMAAFSLQRGDDADKELQKRALQLLKTREPNPVLLGMLGAHFSRHDRNSEQDPELIRLFLDVLLSIKEKSSSAFSPYGRIDAITISLLMQVDDYKRLIQALDTLCADPNNTLSRYYGYSSGGTQKLLTPLTFPPQSIPDFPQAVFSILGSSNRNHIYVMRFSGKLDPDELAKHLDQAQNPILKLLMAVYCDRQDQVKAMVTSFLSRKQPDLAELLVAASWQDSQDGKSKALETLERARCLPMQSKRRRMVDSMILSLASELVDQERAKTVGRAALLRLKSQRLSRNQKVELANFMELFGLKKEAEKVEKALAAMPVPVRSTSMHNPSQMLNDLSDPKKKKQAIARCRRQLRMFATSYARIGLVQNNQWFHLQQLTKQVESARLQDELLKDFEVPIDGTSPVKLFCYAFALEHLKDLKTALPYYERVIELSKKHAGANLQLALYYSRKDPREAQSYLKNIPSRRLVLVPNELLQVNAQVDFDTRLRTGALVCLILERQKERENVPWFSSAVYGMKSNWHDGRSSLHGIYQGSQRKNWSDEQKLVMKEQVALFERLLDLGLKKPAIAATAFEEKLKLYQYQKRDLEPFYDTALAVFENAKPVAMLMGGTHYGLGNNNEPDPIRPEEFLVVEAFKKNKTDELDTLIKKLKNGNSAQVTYAKTLKEFRNLYNASDDKFVDALEELRPGKMPYYLPMKRCLIGIRACENQGRNVDLGSFILKDIAHQTHSLNQFMKPVVAWIKVLRSRGGLKALKSFIAKFYDALFTKAEREEMKNAAPGSITHGSGDIYRKLNVLQQFARGGRKDRDLSILLLAEFGDVMRLSNNSYTLRQLATWPKDKPCTWKWLQQTPFVKNFPEFTFGAYGKDWDDCYLVRALSSLSSKERKSMLAEIQKLKTKTSGVRFIQAVLDGKEQGRNQRERLLLIALLKEPTVDKAAPADLDYLNRLLGRFDKLSEQEQETILKMVGDDGRKRLAKLKTTQEKAKSEKTRKILDQLKKGLSQNNFHNQLQQVAQTIAEIAKTDSAKARSILTTALTQESRFRAANRQFSSGQSVLWNSLRNHTYSNPELASLIFTVASETNDFEGLLLSSYKQNWFNQSRSKTSRRGGQKKKTQAQKLIDRLDAVRSDLEDRKLFYPPIFLKQHLSHMDKAKTDAFDKWVAKYPDSAFVKLTRITFHLASCERNRTAKSLGPSQVQVCSDVLQDEGIAAVARFFLFYELCEQVAPGFGIEHLAASAMSLLSQIETGSKGQSEAPQWIRALARADSIPDKLAEDLLSKYKREATAQILRNSGTVNSHNRNLLLALVELELGRGQSDNAKTLLLDRRYQLKSYPATYLRMAEWGMNEWCSTNLPKEIETLTIRSSRMQRMRLTPGGRKNVKVILDGIEDDSARMLAQIFYAAAPLSGKDGTLDRNAQKVAWEQAATAFVNYARDKGKAYKLRGLQRFFDQDGEHPSVLSPMIVDTFTHTFADALNDRQGKLPGAFAHFWTALLRTGKLPQACKIVQTSTGAIPDDNAYQGQQLLSKMLRSTARYAKSEFPKDRKQQEQWFDLLEAFLFLDPSECERIHLNYSELCSILALPALVFYVDPSRTERWDKLMESKSGKEFVKHVRTSSSSLVTVFREMHHLDEEKDEAILEEKLKLYLDICTDARFEHMISSGSDIVYRFVRSNPYSSDRSKWTLTGIRYLKLKAAHNQALAAAKRAARRGPDDVRDEAKKIVEELKNSSPNGASNPKPSSKTIIIRRKE